MKLHELIEASGHIPTNSKEANDPRWSNAITVDVKPGEDTRQAAKLGFNVKAGRPPKLDPSGKISEAVIDVAIQGREPISPGSRGLMMSRADFGRSIENPDRVLRSAVDALAAELEHKCDVEAMIQVTSQTFKLKDEYLVHAFHKLKGVRPMEYHKQHMRHLKHIPMKI